MPVFGREGDVGTSYVLPTWNWLDAIMDTPASRCAFVAERIGQPSSDPRDGAALVQALSDLRYTVGQDRRQVFPE